MRTTRVNNGLLSHCFMFSNVYEYFDENFDTKHVVHNLSYRVCHARILSIVKIEYS